MFPTILTLCKHSFIDIELAVLEIIKGKMYQREIYHQGNLHSPGKCQAQRISTAR